MKYISSILLLKNGQVRKLFDAKSGKLIRTLQDIQSGQRIVAAGHEAFKKGPYPVADVVPDNSRAYKRERSVNVFIILAGDCSNLFSKR
jgi:hypothetical protein